jgi:hypothetical protein
MKPLSELREFKLHVTHNHIWVKQFERSNLIDYDVYLPTKNKNLQRGFVWSLEQKRELIWSILLERHIPTISVFSLEAKERDAPYQEIVQVIDGKQRLSTMLDFYSEKFTIEIEGAEYAFSELPKEYQLAISNYSITLNVVYDHPDREITDEDKIAWFKRLNFSGTPQEAEHLNWLTE